MVVNERLSRVALPIVMELRHLRYFTAAAEEEHFGRASTRLHVSRPAISQSISDLEAELETELFERLVQGVRLTPAGRHLLPQAKRIMSDLTHALELAKQVGDGKVGKLNIGYGSQTLFHPIFRAVIKRLHDLAPGIVLSLVEVPTSKQRAALTDGKIHAGFVHIAEPLSAGRGSSLHHRRKRLHAEDSLDFLPIQRGRLGLAVSSNHSLSGRASISLAELAGERFVVVPGASVSPSDGPVLSLCQRAGLAPKVVQEVTSVAAQLNLVSVGAGVAFAIAGGDFRYPQGVTVIPLTHVEFSSMFALTWARDRIDPAVVRLIATVTELVNRSSEGLDGQGARNEQ